MTEGFLTCWDGTQYALPSLTAWTLTYTGGVPCDSFLAECPWEGGMEQRLSDATEFTARENGEAVFRGVVDEFETRLGDSGGVLVLSGRGMAARLLDNEAEAADYLVATTADILRDHVTPYGIEIADGGALPGVSNFAVASGKSEWQVLYDFARYHGGVTPRFDRLGRLFLSPVKDGTALVVDDGLPLTQFCYREKRYGVLSEILVRDKTRLSVERVVNQGFRQRGGLCRRVMTMPGRSAFQAMRYRGEFQLAQSAAGRVQCALTVPRLFFAWPGDLVNLARGSFEKNGLYRVLESEVRADENGGRTRILLGEKDALR